MKLNDNKQRYLRLREVLSQIDLHFCYYSTTFLKSAILLKSNKTLYVERSNITLFELVSH